jgi:poly(beta-D-mannuronate) C5 epimerase
VKGKPYLLIVLASVFTAVVLSFALGVDHRALYPFEPVARPAYVTALDPITAAMTGVRPGDTAQVPQSTVEIRAIVVRPTGVALMAGGHRVRFVRGSVKDLNQVVDLVADTSWVRRSADKVQLFAPVILDQVPQFTVSGKVEMVALPGVFLGSKRSHLRIDHAAISAVTEAGAPASGGQYRPFVIADQGSRMDAIESSFVGLGYDWNGSYGVSWMDDSTGLSYSSVYRGGFIGVYTDHARDVEMIGDTFVANTLYGLDPQSGSRGLRIRGCTAEDNGTHGIIFSQEVIASSITDCRSQRNGHNGIMMDARSVGNVITNNVVSNNHGDGIVLSDSPGNTVTGNSVDGNRVGVHVSDSSVIRTRVEGNAIVDNIAAVQGIELTESNRPSRNGSQWEPGRVLIVLISVGVVTLAWLGLTYMLRKRRGSQLIPA